MGDVIAGLDEGLKGNVEYTREEIWTYLDKDFIAGDMPAVEFIGIMLDAATSEGQASQAALKALSVALGNLNEYGLDTNQNTYRIISQGPQNEKTQSVIAALTPEHLSKLRSLFSEDLSLPFTEECYFLSLSQAPQLAVPEDMAALTDHFRGEPPLMGTKEDIDPARPNYYPRRIRDLMRTTKAVITNRPDLLDESAVMEINGLPGKIENSKLFIRPSYDRNIPKEDLFTLATDLQQHAMGASTN